MKYNIYLKVSVVVVVVFFFVNKEVKRKMVLRYFSFILNVLHLFKAKIHFTICRDISELPNFLSEQCALRPLLFTQPDISTLNSQHLFKQ